MKYFKVLLTIILAFVVVPTIVLAAENSISLECNTVVSKGDELSVDIVLTTKDTTNGFAASFTYEKSALELLSIENKDNWERNQEGETESENGPLTLKFTHPNGISGKTTVATIRFKVKKDATKSSAILTIEGTVTAKEDGTTSTLEKVEKKIDIKSTDNTLKDLKFNGETFINFKPTQYSYTKEVDSSVITANIEAELNDPTAKFKDKYAPKTGQPLDYGKNVFEIIVVSASGEEKKYVITIVRADNRGTNNNLKSLLINSNPKLFTFDKSELEYTITTHKLKTIDVTAIPEDEKAKVDIKKPDELKIGLNEVTITVTSEKKESKVYKITINNVDTDIDTTLSNIEIFGLDEEFNFEKDKLDYEVLYKEKYKDTIVIKPVLSNKDEAEYDRAKLESDISNLGPDKKVTITVKAKDGTKGVERVYTITFKKDTRINFFLILGLIIFIVLLVIFIRLVLEKKRNDKQNTNNNNKKEKEEELVKTKKLEKVRGE